MNTLIVSIERNGNMIQVGKIVGNDASDASFRYHPEYLDSSDAAAISISLPLREEPYSTAQTASFFEGLLPEGFTRRSVAQWMHADENDYLSILHGLGRECLGAICVTAEHEELEAAYEPVTAQQVRDLASEGATKSAELVTKSHLSLTGASGKVGLYYSKDQDNWFLPKGTAPSTHIVKQSHIRLDSIVTNEQLALSTASKCGIIIPDSFIINTGEGKENEVLFATERYDRMISNQSSKINGLYRPLRLHQEDFAQAMGIPSSRKYEKKTAEYMRGMFDILRRYSSDPVRDQLRLWDIIVFNYLIGNTDAHIKNFSLLYNSSLKSLRLAPAYDIVSTTVYDQSTRDMAFNIGGVYSIDEIERGHFITAAKAVGLGERMAMKRFDDMCGRFKKALKDSAEELVTAGYPKASEIHDRILESGGIRYLT